MYDDSAAACCRGNLLFLFHLFASLVKVNETAAVTVVPATVQIKNRPKTQSTMLRLPCNAVFEGSISSSVQTKIKQNTFEP